MTSAPAPKHALKEPSGLSPRIAWLRDYYFRGKERAWNNQFTAWTTGTPWDNLFNEITFYNVPETFLLLSALSGSFLQSARKVPLHPEFWQWSLPERRAWFVREVIVNKVPLEILPGDLIAGARFNVQASLCLNEKEAREWNRLVRGKNGARQQVMWFHGHGYGNAGATSGHLIPGHERLLTLGWKGIHEDLLERYNALGGARQRGPGGAQLRAMLTAATMARDLAARYRDLCRSLAGREQDSRRRKELERMAANLDRVPWEPPADFWEAVQALWLNHMLVLTDENYPGAGVSFGRMDQYLLPFYQRSMQDGMDREFAKEILKCFWVHCNTAYDAMIANGHQGITAGFGQLLTLSGLGKDGRDMTNELTLPYPGSHRRDVSHPGAQAQRSPAPQLSR
jgi:trans-4-hydroxy-L-proline dehydratase